MNAVNNFYIPMVERPIKKSDRPQRDPNESPSDDRRESREGSRDSRDKNRKGGRGKGREEREERQPATPPALMRGPKPQLKVEAPIIAETEDESISQESTEETIDTSDTPALSETDA